MKWRKTTIKERKLYITKADKCGVTLICDADTVYNIVLEIHQNEKKYIKLNKDLRNNIKGGLKQLINKYSNEGMLIQNLRLAITGQMAKGWFSQNNEFCEGPPYIYPLFKIHKLTEVMIKSKIVPLPPTRMVTSGIGGPTYHLEFCVTTCRRGLL